MTRTVTAAIRSLQPPLTKQYNAPFPRARIFAGADAAARKHMATKAKMNGDLNNTSALRKVNFLKSDPAYTWRSLAIPANQDDSVVRAKYRSFLLPDEIASNDWIAALELSTALKMVEADLTRTGGDRLKILMLYGSLRSRSYSRLLTFESARILHRLGCDVRVFDPAGLPVKDDVQHDHHKVQELRELSKWSDGHVWISPEQHGQLVSYPLEWHTVASGGY